MDIHGCDLFGLNPPKTNLLQLLKQLLKECLALPNLTFQGWTKAFPIAIIRNIFQISKSKPWPTAQIWPTKAFHCPFHCPDKVSYQCFRHKIAKPNSMWLMCSQLLYSHTGTHVGQTCITDMCQLVATKWLQE